LLDILLVEDDTGDIELITEAIQESKKSIRLNITRNGIEAINYLRHISPYESAHLPDLVLLDLNLPRKNGYEVLTDIRSDGTLKHIPVVVLTTSISEHDILAAYQSGANSYIPKPSGLDDYIHIIQTLSEFWMNLAIPPKSTSYTPSNSRIR